MTFSTTPAVYPRIVELPLHPESSDPGTGWFIELSAYVRAGWYHTEEAARLAMGRMQDQERRDAQIPLPL